MTSPTNTDSAAQKQESSKEENLANLRKRVEQEREARERLELEVSELQKEREQYKQQPKKEEDYPTNYDGSLYVDEARMDKKLQKMEQKIAGEIERRAAEMIKKEKDAQYLKQNPDFHKMLTNENVTEFVEKNESLAEAISKIPVEFEKQKMLYEAIKMHKKANAPPPIQEKINANFGGGYYAPSNSGTPPYTTQGDFSEAGQKAAWEKVQELKKRIQA